MKCTWTTCNALTDYEYVICEQDATHKVTIEDDPPRFLCLAHAQVARAITNDVQHRYPHTARAATIERMGE